MGRTKAKDKKLSCTDCGVLNCHHRDKEFPQFCLTTNTDIKEIEKINEMYRNNGLDAKMAHAAAEVEGIFYGKLTRVEEIIEFARRIGAKKIGIATCIGLINEAKTFAKILNVKGLNSYSVICKVGSVDKTVVGIAEELKVQKGSHEPLCNPILQAQILNQEKTDLNVIVGLCVGHDSLFIKYSKAPVTTLITKDRVMGHNPAAALYTSNFYYKRLMEEE